MVKSDILGKLKSIFTNEKNKQNKIFSYRRFTFNIFLIVLILILVIQIYFKINKLDGILTIDIMSVLLLTLLYSAIFLSLALGLNLTYKILGFANFSHAEFLTIGGYFAIFLQLTPWFTKSIDGAPEGILREHLLIYAMIIGFFGTGLIAVIIDYLVYRPLRKRDAKPDTMMIASLGVALVIRGLLYVRFTGANSYFVPPEGEIIEVHELKTIKIRIFLGSKFFDSELVKTGSGCVGTILCTFNFKDLFWFLIKIIILTTILLFIFINYTKTGKAMRAVADNVDLAASSGINVERIRILTWFIGGGIAGMAGVVWSALFKISPITGSIYLLAAFAVIVLGSIGSLEGGVIASLIIGFARALSYPILAGLGNPLNRNAMSSYVDVIPFAILILILLFYSDGIGERIKQRKIELARIELRNAELGIVTHKSFIKRFFNQFFMELQFGIIKFIAIITFLSKYIINPLKQVKTKFIIMLSPLTNIITLSIQNIKNIIYKLRKTISRKFGKYSLNNFQPFSSRYPMGLRDESFQNNLFILFIIFILILILNLPASNEDNRRMIFLLGFFITWIIFAILALSLNFHTGITGLVNFGVVFFAGIGAITTSLYSFHNKNIFIGINISPFIGIILGTILAFVIGYLLAYPTIKLRSDYFAIVTISISEILRIMLNVEPFLRTRRAGDTTTSPGISEYSLPLNDWWMKAYPKEEIPYNAILFIIAIILFAIVFLLSQLFLNSPYGRILKSIREDEEVTETYGYNVFKYKAIALAIGGAMAALAGGIWAWYLTNVFPDLLTAATSTFLVWAAFVMGGKGNNKGMIVGSGIIILTDYTFRFLTNLRTTGESNWFIGMVDWIFRLIVVDIGGNLFGKATISETLSDDVHVNLIYLQVALVGLMIIIGMIRFEKGFIPEKSYRPRQSSNIVKQEMYTKAMDDLREREGIDA